MFFYPGQRDYIAQLNALADAVGGLTGGGYLPRLARFLPSAPQSHYPLPAAPRVALLSLNGLWQHDARLAGADMVIDPPAEAGDDILVVYWE